MLFYFQFILTQVTDAMMSLVNTGHTLYEDVIWKRPAHSCNLLFDIYASANIVAGGGWRHCFQNVHESRTNVVSKIYCIFVDGIWPLVYQ